MNKVTPEHINKLVETLQFDTHHFEGTNYTVAIAKFPDGFVVANGVSSCVVSSNFNKNLGEKYAIEDAKAKAIDKLWELEGYFLYKNKTQMLGQTVQEMSEWIKEEIEKAIEEAKQDRNFATHEEVQGITDKWGFPCGGTPSKYTLK